ncbi:hypothetical protein V6Z11_A10G000200 [Gossypium hirsutum]
MMRAQEADPTNLEVLLALGVSHTNELEQTAALKYLYGWLRHHPKYGTLAPPELANSLYYADALDLKPNYVRAWANMGISYANQYCVQFKTMKIAVEGCMHGDLDKVYDTIKYIENTRNIKIDLLLCYGDFQAVRNGKDMDSLNVAPKYREMKSFWKYYSGQEVAPVPTIFIGGNNEASNYLWELYYGGWAASNIYFLGYAVVVKFGNIRIDGLSGIYNARNYCLGHHERTPYNDNTISITDYGNWQQLVCCKKNISKIQQGTLGNKPAAQLLEKLRPSYWFSAHLHCKFTALVEHEEGGQVTKFRALDKCLPGRKFLQVVDIDLI